jgi:Protein of unknown function (DUF1552)
MNGIISRRTVLKGLGTAIALPFLEAMGPTLALADVKRSAAPKHMAFIYIPNGAHMEAWTPAAEGVNFVLPPTLEPLKPLQDRLFVLSGLTLNTARPLGDGPGDHARAMSAFLTGAHPRKTYGADIKIGVSADQVAAQKIGQETRFPSLELGCEGGKLAGNCDSGYSCAYSSNLSWRTETTPNAKEINPRLVFERLFGNQIKGDADANRAKRERYKKSILDFVNEDARKLRMKLGAPDQRKLDEYLSSLREVETRITRASQLPEAKAPNGIVIPGAVPQDYQEHLRLMCDLMVLAFQADLTRVATFVFANDGSNRSYKLIDVAEGHHDLSHHGGNKEKQAKIAKINRFHITQFAYLLEKMKAVQESEGTLLDNSMIVMGGGIGDGNRHNHDELPILLAGKGGGTLKPGRHIRYKKETPLANLYLGMLDRIGAPTEKLGDSTGKLESLS